MGKPFSKNNRNKNITEKHDSNKFLRASTLAISNNTIIHRVRTNYQQNYTILNNLGKGAFSSVELVKNNISGEQRAMKVIKLTEKLS